MKQRGREFWEQLVAALATSGLSQQAFAEQHGVKVTTLRSWLYKLRHSPTPSAFVPVQLRVANEPLLNAVLVLEFPHGLRLSVPAGTEPSYVAALVSALASTPC